LVNSLFERAVRAISVQLATGADAPSVALAATGAMCLLCLDVRVDRGRDQLIGTTSPVLVEDRRPFAVVPHPGHQVPQPGAAHSCQVVPGVPKVVKVQAFGVDRADRVRPGGRLVKRRRCAAPGPAIAPASAFGEARPARAGPHPQGK